MWGGDTQELTGGHHGSLWGLSYNINTKGGAKSWCEIPPGHTGQAQRARPRAGALSSAPPGKHLLFCSARGVRYRLLAGEFGLAFHLVLKRLQVLLLCFLFFLADFQPLLCIPGGPPAAWSALAKQDVLALGGAEQVLQGKEQLKPRTEPPSLGQCHSCSPKPGEMEAPHPSALQQTCGCTQSSI